MARNQGRVAPAGAQPQIGKVTIDRQAPGLAVVSVRGEHDLSTHATLTLALDSAAGDCDVLIDLTECTFMDSSVISALIATARDVQSRDQQLAVVIPVERANLSRVAEMTGLAEILALYTSRAAALSRLGRITEAPPPIRR
jgi:anti-sigma B factor antagonist